MRNCLTRILCDIAGLAIYRPVRDSFFASTVLVAMIGISASLGNLQADTNDWLSWRGPKSTGAADETSRPTTRWSANQNIVWKVPLPGRGHSTPIVLGNKVIVTTAVPTGPKLEARYSGRPGAHDNLPVDSKYDFVALCLERNSGKVVWTKTLNSDLPLEGAHKSASLASASPVSDGERIFVYFGSFGLYCLDLDGNTVWSKDLGKMHTKHGHGEGASPVLHKGVLVVNWDHEEQSFILALNASTGEVLWKRQRDEVTSWSSPIVAEHDGKEQLIVAGTDRVRSYELRSGAVIWECGGMSANIVATPVFTNGILYVGSSYEKRILMAIRLEGAQGDITGTENVLWSRTRGTPYVPSLLVVDGGLYFLAHYQNILTRVDAPSGQEAPGPVRLGELVSIYASPVAANGNVYVTDLEGTTMVLTTGDQPELVSVNRLNEAVNASLAIAGDQIFIRGQEHLYCIAEQN